MNVDAALFPHIDHRHALAVIRLRKGVFQRRTGVAQRLPPHPLRPVDMPQRDVIKGVEHRLEKVRTIHGVTYYNDSKGTNVDASMKALEAFPQGHLILIAGGYDKKTPLDDFMALAAKRVDTLILIGDAAERFEAAAKKAGIQDIRRTGYSMEGAIMLARKIAKAPQAVLLSPACSSFDMYDNFEQRGRVFKGIVNAI